MINPSAKFERKISILTRSIWITSGLFLLFMVMIQIEPLSIIYPSILLILLVFNAYIHFKLVFEHTWLAKYAGLIAVIQPVSTVYLIYRLLSYRSNLQYFVDANKDLNG